MEGGGNCERKCMEEKHIKASLKCVYFTYRVYNHTGSTGPGFTVKLHILDFSHCCYYCDLCCYSTGDWKKFVQTGGASDMMDDFSKIGISPLNIFCMKFSRY